MTVDELRKSLKDVPGDIIVATDGYFGELGRELESVTVKVVPISVFDRKLGNVRILCLDGMPVSYDEEPDW